MSSDCTNILVLLSNVGPERPTTWEPNATKTRCLRAFGNKFIFHCWFFCQSQQIAIVIWPWEDISVLVLLTITRLIVISTRRRVASQLVSSQLMHPVSNDAPAPPRFSHYEQAKLSTDRVVCPKTRLPSRAAAAAAGLEDHVVNRGQSRPRLWTYHTC